MFDDLPPPKKTGQDFPRRLDVLSVGEMEAYIDALHAEIARVEADIVRKKASRDAADSVFGGGKS